MNLIESGFKSRISNERQEELTRIAQRINNLCGGGMDDKVSLGAL